MKVEIKITLVVDEHRAKIIANELGDKALISPDERYFPNKVLEISIDSDLDILNIFHAGVKVGLSKY